jgi:hypothetical protein
VKVNVNFKCFLNSFLGIFCLLFLSVIVCYFYRLLSVMMKLVLNRFRTVRGAVVGRLSLEIVDRKGGVVDHEHICDTVEREGGCLEPGEYRVVVAKCRSFARKMMFLEAVKKEASSSSDASSGVGCSPLPLPEICERCRLERKHHRFGCLDELHALSCPMLQPGNGPFRLRKGGILIGEAHAPGFVLRSQELFLQLFDRVNKVLRRGGEVVVEVNNFSHF